MCEPRRSKRVKMSDVIIKPHLLERVVEEVEKEGVDDCGPALLHLIRVVPGRHPPAAYQRDGGEGSVGALYQKQHVLPSRRRTLKRPGSISMRASPLH